MPPLPPLGCQHGAVGRGGRGERGPGGLDSAPAAGGSGLEQSVAVDARLECGVALMAELRLIMMNNVHASRLTQAVHAPFKVGGEQTWFKILN